MSEMQKQNDKLLSLMKMALGNLGKEDDNQAIPSMLSIDDASRTAGLSSICYRSTMGNPFFLLEFAKLLEEE
eukprot:8277924-Ditylum_brightwellii.AAC.1